MGTTTLVDGGTTIWKNGAYVANATTSLLYDSDLRIFQVVLSNGSIFANFNPNQVTDISHATTGTFVKEYALHIGTRSPNGDEFAFRFYTGSLGKALAIEGWIRGHVRRDTVLNPTVEGMTFTPAGAASPPG